MRQNSIVKILAGLLLACLFMAEIHIVAEPSSSGVEPIPISSTSLIIFVKSIVCNENDCYAVIEFEGKEKTIRKDQIVEGKFKVIDINSKRVVIYSYKDRVRRSFLNGIPILEMLIKSIVCNENDRYAVIELEGKEMTIRKDQIVEGKFKVISINSRRVLVYSYKENCTHSLMP